MSTTTLHIKTETETRDEATKIAKEFGFGTLTSMVNVLLKQLIRTRKVTLDLAETPNAQTIADLKQAEEDVEKGRVIPFPSGKEALEYLDKKITHEKRAAH